MAAARALDMRASKAEGREVIPLELGSEDEEEERDLTKKGFGDNEESLGV